MKTLRKVATGPIVVGLFTALSFSQREDAASRETTMTAVTGVVLALSIITLSIKEDYGISEK